MSRPWPSDPEEYMAAYLDAWNEGDTDRVCDAYHVPALIHKNVSVQANLDPAARFTYLGTYLDSTRDELSKGSRWECRSLEIRDLGPDAVLATARWTFRRTDGTVLEDYPDSYLLVRVGGRWAFMADVVHTA
jgi:Domain of unknown function (DUF4440)